MNGTPSEESLDSAQRIDSFNGEQRVYFVPLRYLLSSSSLLLSLSIASFYFMSSIFLLIGEYSANLNRIRVSLIRTGWIEILCGV